MPTNIIYPEGSSVADDEKIRENRLRRMAERQGYQLRKSRRRDPRAIDYGAYWLEPTDYTGTTDTLSKYQGVWSLDDVERWLTSDRSE